MKIWRIRHIRTRLFWAFILMAALTLALLWLIQAGLLRDSYIRGKISSVETALSSVQRVDQDILASVEEVTGSSVFVFSETGDILYRSQAMPMPGMMQRRIQSMLADESQVRKDVRVEVVEAGHTGIRYAIMIYPLQNEGSIASVFSLADSDEAARILRQQLWLISLLLVFFSLILSILLSRRIAQPIQAVTAAAHQLSAGTRTRQLKIPSEDEIGQLTMALNDLNLQLQQNEALQKELIANVSHELKAPLSIIKGYAETLRDVSWYDNAKRTAQLSLISEEADRLSRIIRDILDYSRLQSGVSKLQLSDFAIKPVLEKLILLQEQIAHDNNLTLEVDGPDCVVQFDRTRFEQVCINLMQNAILHADSHTAVTISTQLMAEPASNSSVCRLMFRNRGKTIAPEYLPKIWDRYYQLERPDGRQPLGTGLGLAIVKSILEQHDIGYGVISVDGTTSFWLDLPQKDHLQP